MGAAVSFCILGSEMLDGPDRAKALRAFDYIGEKLAQVTAVARIVESRDNQHYNYYVLRFDDGSHLCTCRTLQKLGVFCRHGFAAMLLSALFGFNVGLVHEHWLNQKARETPQESWPHDGVPKWILADNHGGAEGKMKEVVGSTSTGGWLAYAGTSYQTVQTVLLDVKEKGPSEQDRRVVFADVTKMCNEACAIMSDTLPPGEARILAENFVLNVRRLAVERNGQDKDGRTVLGNMPTVRLPARASSKRQKSSIELNSTQQGSKSKAQRR